MGFFFFQAEDGIRDDLVTGVQTCALPISARRADGELRGRRGAAAAAGSARPGPARAPALVESGGELAARLARQRVLDAELVEDADDRAAQVVAALRVALGGDGGDQAVEPRLEVAAVERLEGGAQILVV